MKAVTDTSRSKVKQNLTSLTSTQFAVSRCRTVWRNALDLEELSTATVLAVVTADYRKAKSSRCFHKTRLNKLTTKVLLLARELTVLISSKH